MNIGSNVVNYDRTTNSLTVDLITIQLLLNSVLSALGVKFMTIDIENMPENRSKRKKCMFLIVELMPE